MKKFNKRKIFILGLALAITVVPKLALASGGVSEFSTPLQKLIDLFTGPWAVAISTLCFIVAFVGYMMQGSEASETMKGVIKVAIPAGALTGAGPLVNWAFSFSGAIL